MNYSNKIVRWIIFIVGIILMSFGIAIVTQAGIGTSPISSLPLVSSYVTDYSFGETTFFINVILVILQVLILRKDFRWTIFLQIPLVYLFAIAIDISMSNTQFLTTDHLALQIMINIFGIIVMGLGIACEVWSNIMMLPGEGFVLAVALKSKKPFHKIKVINDVTLVILAILLSLVYFHGLKGIGLGTLISAVLTGYSVHFWTLVIRKIVK